MKTQAANAGHSVLDTGGGQRRVTARQAGRVVVLTLALTALGMASLDSPGAVNVFRGVVSTLAFVTVAGFVALDVAGALPASLTTRPFVWALIVPVSLGINVITGTVLAAFGPGMSSAWFWGVTVVMAGLAESAHLMGRRLA
jgi:hypothetical protein